MNRHLTTDQKIARLEHTIVILRRKLASIPTTAEADDIGIRAAEKRVKGELQRELSARFRFGSDGKYHLQIANVTASSQDGGISLFRRWHINASRTVIMMKVKAA